MVSVVIIYFIGIYICMHIHTSIMVSVVITHCIGLLCMHIHIPVIVSVVITHVIGILCMPILTPVMVSVVITHVIGIDKHAYSHISHDECWYYTWFVYYHIWLVTHQSW